MEGVARIYMLTVAIIAKTFVKISSDPDSSLLSSCVYTLWLVATSLHGHCKNRDAPHPDM